MTPDLYAALTASTIPQDSWLAYCSHMAGRPLKSLGDMTPADEARVLHELGARS